MQGISGNARLAVLLPGALVSGVHDFSSPSNNTVTVAETTSNPGGNVPVLVFRTRSGMT